MYEMYTAGKPWTHAIDVPLQENFKGTQEKGSRTGKQEAVLYV